MMIVLVTPVEDCVLLTPYEIAGILGISKSKTHSLMRSGELRSVRIGRSRRVSQRALRDFVDTLTGEHTA